MARWGCDAGAASPHVGRPETPPLAAEAAGTGGRSRGRGSSPVVPELDRSPAAVELHHEMDRLGRTVRVPAVLGELLGRLELPGLQRLFDPPGVSRRVPELAGLKHPSVE